MSDKGLPLLRLKELVVHFRTRGPNGARQTVQAVNDVNLDIYPGETLGLVGESGCGKSTTARAALMLLRPTSGHVYFQDQDLAALDSATLRESRRHFQMVFQDPYAAFNPRLSVGQVISEPLRAHRVGDASQRRRKVEDLLELVGLPAATYDKDPRSLSGGQLQRVGIARAISIEPELIVADEPVSALDVSVQAQILNLLKDLQERLGLALLFISHDLNVVEHISDRIGVMYLGRLVEIGPASAICSSPQHPYTQALMRAVPQISRDRRQTLPKIAGEVPSPVSPPSGCPFRTRCPAVMDVCREVMPPIREIEPNRFVACHLTDPEVTTQKVPSSAIDQ